MGSNDLHVTYERKVPIGTEMAFRADRLSGPAADQWVLCVSSDLPAVRLAGVSPAALGYVLDRDGVLGLIFPADVASVRLTVESVEVGESEWRFWVVDGQIHHNRQTKAGG